MRDFQLNVFGFLIFAVSTSLYYLTLFGPALSNSECRHLEPAVNQAYLTPAGTHTCSGKRLRIPEFLLVKFMPLIFRGSTLGTAGTLTSSCLYFYRISTSCCATLNSSRSLFCQFVQYTLRRHLLHLGYYFCHISVFIFAPYIICIYICSTSI